MLNRVAPYKYADRLARTLITEPARTFPQAFAFVPDFVRSGLINYASVNSFSVSGQNGYYWSSAPYHYAGIAAYVLLIDSSRVDSSYVGGNFRYVGFPLRCLAS